MGWCLGVACDVLVELVSYRPHYSPSWVAGCLRGKGKEGGRKGEGRGKEGERRGRERGRKGEGRGREGGGKGEGRGREGGGKGEGRGREGGGKGEGRGKEGGRKGEGRAHSHWTWQSLANCLTFITSSTSSGPPHVCLSLPSSSPSLHITVTRITPLIPSSHTRLATPSLGRPPLFTETLLPLL